MLPRQKSFQNKNKISSHFFCTILIKFSIQLSIHRTKYLSHTFNSGWMYHHFIFIRKYIDTFIIIYKLVIHYLYKPIVYYIVLLFYILINTKRKKHCSQVHHNFFRYYAAQRNWIPTKFVSKNRKRKTSQIDIFMHEYIFQWFYWEMKNIHTPFKEEGVLYICTLHR